MAYNVISCQKVAENTQSLNSLCKSGSRPQKSTKKRPKKRITQSRFTLNFWIGMVYFGYHLVKAHVQTVQNMYGERGVESLQGRVTAARSWPLIREEKKYLKRCSEKPYGHNFHISALKLNQRYFDIYEISDTYTYAYMSVCIAHDRPWRATRHGTRMTPWHRWGSSVLGRERVVS